MILRFFNWQGIAGIAAAATLLFLLLFQRHEVKRWRHQSSAFERLYRDEQAAHVSTVANARAAAEVARAADKANADRVAAEQRVITERTSSEYEARLAAARARAEQLRIRAEAAAGPGAGRGSSVPGLPAAAGVAAQTAGQDRLPPGEALTATEQAIQLDELIKWVRAQAKVDNNPPAGASPPGD